uniref:Uncharacterized protein n=1 Tax=Acrobeloides nanus TaxID=290746 RepID=A0A914BXM5_9BILA
MVTMSLVVVVGLAFYPTQESTDLGRMVMRNSSWLDPSDPIPAFIITDIVKFDFNITDLKNFSRTQNYS